MTLQNQNGNSEVLMVGINTKLKDVSPIILSGHIDTVSANMKEYTTNPFELTKKDNKMYGLGSIDMKSFFSVILDNIDNIKQIKAPIVLVATTDEETKLSSIEVAINKMKQLNIKPKFTILGEPTKSNFCIKSNACYEYCVNFFGKACHSSILKNGINAICACAKLITFIEKTQEQFNLTSNCGVISGGEVVNKVPDFAKLLFDVRSTEKESVEKFVEEIKKELEILKNEYGISYELNKKLSIPPLDLKDILSIKEFANILQVELNNFSGGCEAGYYTDYCGEAVIFGVGDLSLAHKPNEYVVIDEYYDYSKKFIKLLELIDKKYF